MLTQYETDHHIKPGTLTKLGWSECERTKNNITRPAIQFPTPSGPRWRYTDGQKPKYDHGVGYVACWYGLKAAVKMAENMVFLVDCNGAASTIAAQQHGLPAFSLQSGEGTKPKPELIAELKALWHEKVYVAFDCDEAGHKGALTRIQVYRDAGIECEALDLNLGIKGGDLADFVGTHADNPICDFLICKRLVVPDKPKPAPKKHDKTTFADWEDALDAIKSRLSCYDFMVQRYGEPPKKGRSYGHWIAIQRSEDSPSFAAYMDTGGFYDYGSGDAGDLFDLIILADKCDFAKAIRTAADLTGVALPEHKQSVVKSAKVEEPVEVPSGLPISIRAALNLYASGPVGVTVETFYDAIEKGYCTWTDQVDANFLICVSEVMQNRGVSSRTIRSGLNQGVEQFFSKWLYIDPISEESGESNTYGKTQERTKTPCKHRSGRKSVIYTLKPLPEIVKALTKLAIVPLLKAEFPANDEVAAPVCAEFLEELGMSEAEAREKAGVLKERYSDALAGQQGFKNRLAHVRKVYARFAANLNKFQYAPFAEGRRFSNHREYVAECARAIVEKHGGETQFSRTRLCEIIGCRDRELPGIFKRAGLLMLKHQHVERLVTYEELIGIKQGYDFERAGMPDRVQSNIDKHPMKFGAATMPRWAQAQVDAGATLKLIYNQANKQVIALSPEPKPKAEPSKLDPQPALFSMEVPCSFMRFWWCWIVTLVTNRIYEALCFVWCFLRDLGQSLREVAHKLTYGESWLRKVVTVATPCVADGDRLIDRSTGEIQPYSVQLTLDVLLPVAPGPAPGPSPGK